MIQKIPLQLWGRIPHLKTSKKSRHTCSHMRTNSMAYTFCPQVSFYFCPRGHLKQLAFATCLHQEGGPTDKNSKDLRQTNFWGMKLVSISEHVCGHLFLI